MAPPYAQGTPYPPAQQYPQGPAYSPQYPQGQQYPPQYPQAQQYPPMASPEQAPAALLSPEQLNMLVAPVALYPDALLSQVLVACTYPLEIAEAAQWLQQNRYLEGQQLVAAAQQQNWDPSIQALVVFPDVLFRLNSDLRWTTDLGNAFLSQQADVMSAVQRLRSEAMASGRLASNPEQTVSMASQGDQRAIEIQPTNPDVMYVPNYNPAYVWGPPAWGAYPALYYPGVSFGFGYYAGVFVRGFFAGLTWGGWGWGPNWFLGSIFQNLFFFNHFGFHGWGGWGGGFGGRALWTHNPMHRMGVPYPNRALASRFGGRQMAGGFANRGYAGGRANFGNSFAGRANAFAGGNAMRGGWAASRGYSQPAFRGNSAFGGGAYRSAPAYGGMRNAPDYRTAPAFGRENRSPLYAGGFGGARGSGHSFGGFRGGNFRGGQSRGSNPGHNGFHGGGGGGSHHGGGSHGGGSHGGGHKR